MPIVNARELSRMHRQLGTARTVSLVRECLERHRNNEPGGLSPEEFSLRDVAEAVIPDGREWVRSIGPNAGEVQVLESGAVDTSAFSAITGQVVYAQVLRGFTHEEFILSNVIPTRPTRFSGERLPGLSRLGDAAEEVAEGMPYPRGSFSEEYIDTPETVKRGLIVEVTREMVYFDRTNMVLDRAGSVGETLGLRKEKLLLDLLIGAVNTYNANGTTEDTYQEDGSWTNDQVNPLIDWTSLDSVYRLASRMVDPTDGEPILMRVGQVIVSPARELTARRILSATQVDSTTAGVSTVTANPLANRFQVLSSAQYWNRLQQGLGYTADEADGCWIAGDLPRAIAWMENWPLRVDQRATESDAHFERDIVLGFKASHRGAAAMLQPRCLFRNTAS